MNRGPPIYDSVSYLYCTWLFQEHGDGAPFERRNYYGGYIHRSIYFWFLARDATTEKLTYSINTPSIYKERFRHTNVVLYFAATIPLTTNDRQDVFDRKPPLSLRFTRRSFSVFSSVPTSVRRKRGIETKRLKIRRGLFLDRAISRTQWTNRISALGFFQFRWVKW